MIYSPLSFAPQLICSLLCTRLMIMNIYATDMFYVFVCIFEVIVLWLRENSMESKNKTIKNKIKEEHKTENVCIKQKPHVMKLLILL